MLCQKCGLNEATVHRGSMVFRQTVQEHLCELCAGVGADVTPALSIAMASGHRSATRYLGQVQGATAEFKHPKPGGPPFNRPPIQFDRFNIPAIVAATRDLFSPFPGALCVFFGANQVIPRLFVLRIKGEVEFRIWLTKSDPSAADAKVRALFAERNIALLSEGPGGLEAIQQQIVYRHSGSPHQIAMLLVDLLVGGFDLTETDKIGFWFTGGSPSAPGGLTSD